MSATRNAMKEYWSNFSASVESMMLDDNANTLSPQECDEILEKLPPLEDTNILELGAGIGRFTERLASRCNSVIAVDFMEEYVIENRARHSNRTNVKVLCEDATKLSFPPNTFDVVFSNWLLMYLDDDECSHLIGNCLMWLKPEGHLFIRESCLRPSGNSDKRPRINPSRYRTPNDYYILLTQAGSDLGNIGFSIESVSNVKTYVERKNNPNQICFLASKQTNMAADKKYRSFQEFLDKSQYTRAGVQRYEWIFGETFLSSGGLETTKKIVAEMGIKSGNRILDVGCGIGGHDFYIAENFDVHITAVDLSANMMTVALEHFSKRPHLATKIQFEITDITTANYEANSFDIIYSRDTLLHIADKPSLFTKLHNWLAPGGKIVFTDYGQSNREHSSEFKEYVTQRGYNLLTVDQYSDLLKKSGFDNVRVDDVTPWWKQTLQTELDRLVTGKNNFLKQFSEADFEYLKQGWEAKLQRVDAGDQIWIKAFATK